MHWRERGFGIALAAIAVLRVLDLDDVRRAYPSPERHEQVRRFSVDAHSASASSRRENATHDFDGDGITDTFDVTYFHMEPLFRRATSGMLRVSSGADGATLLVHALDTPMNSVDWCGDRDGNGTEDLLVSDEGERFVLAFMK